MPFDGSGNFNRVMNWQSDAAAGIKIRSDRHDQEDDNLAAGLSNVLCKDGQSQPTADLPMNGFKFTNLGAPTNPTDAATKGYADAIRNFNSAINLTGAVPEARIGFTGADIGFGARVAGTPAGAENRFVWNDKPDLSGTDVMVLRDSGFIQLSPSGVAAIWARSRSTDVADHSFNIGYLGAPNDVPTAGAQIGIRGHDFAGNPGGIDFYGAGAAGALAVLGSWKRDGRLDVVGLVASTQGWFVGSTNSIVLGNGSGAGTVYLRPNGAASATGQNYVDSSGNFFAAGSIFSVGGALRTRAIGTGNSHVFFENSVGAERCLLYADNASNLQIRVGAGAGNCSISAAGNFVIFGSVGQKATGTTWSNPSDERIKDVVGDYDKGLAEIMQLQPRRFVYRGNDTFGPPGVDPVNPEGIQPMIAGSPPYPDSPHYKDAIDGTEFPGFVAQEVETVMPSMVTQATGYIDGEEVTDFRVLDTSNLALAMVNAIKELATRVEALEAAA